ncbi:MAG: acetolactate decarboxylase [Bacteroidota bacterium]
MRNIYFIGWTLFLLFSCKNDPASNTAQTFEVHYKGALKNIMRKGDLSAKVNLADYQNRPHLYALGPLAGLKGEIQIFDGKVYNSMVKNGQLVFDTTYTQQASLLVSTSVEAWEDFIIPAHVQTKKALQQYVAKTAKNYGIDVYRPFPFLLVGTAASIDWHVINWKAGDTKHSHEKHVQSGLYGTLTNQELEILGFYSDKHHAIFTHHTTNMHLHAKLKDGTMAGHIDDIALDGRLKLQLPKLDQK